jgi:type I restriction enzyme R subunit
MEFVEFFAGAPSVRAQCRLLNVSRSGYYYQACPESPENLRLMRRIDELHLRQPVYGSPRLTAELRREGWAVNVKRVARLMGVMGIEAIYATNGHGIYGIDTETGKEGEVAAYPTPDELWALTFAEANAWRDRFAAVPYEDKGGSHPGRYYQDIAIERVMQAIAEDRPRILLTLATGTGKTFIAFQIAWKLFHSRWNLSHEPSRRPRILFLADRNILADQAYNAFSAFPEDAMVRIDPADIRKKGKVPKNGSLFFTIFQTFMSGPPKDGQPSP